MNFDEFRSASGSSRRADQHAGNQADRVPNGARRRTAGSDEPAHDDGRIPTVRNADRAQGSEENDAAGRARAIERERGLAEFLPDAYLVTDAAGVIQGANQAAAQLFGKRDAALRGASIAELLIPADRARFRARLRPLPLGQ